MIYKKPKTGVFVSRNDEAQFFEVEAVYLRVKYARTKADLQAGKHIHTRDHKIVVSEDLENELLKIHTGAVKQ